MGKHYIDATYVENVKEIYVEKKAGKKFGVTLFGKNKKRDAISTVADEIEMRMGALQIPENTHCWIKHRMYRGDSGGARTIETTVQCFPTTDPPAKKFKTQKMRADGWESPLYAIEDAQESKRRK